jgi:nucleotide-binding universal stress UspA family protein
MKTFHNLIVAIDFTPSCRRALREAARRASLDAAQITAVHVMDEFLVHELKKALSTTEAVVRAEWEAKLRKFVDDSDAGGGLVKTEVRVGHPFGQLVEACYTHKADLLVMGVRGSKNQPNRVGAIVAKCIRRAPVDVLVVQQESLSPFKHVVTCVDFSENSAKAVQCALHVAQQDGAALDCLHVYQSALAMAMDYGGFVTSMPAPVLDEEGVHSWQVQLDTFLEPLLRKAESTTVQKMVVEQTNVRQGLLDFAKQSEADLVVLGTTGKGSLRHMLIGTTAEKIVQYATCSLLVVKPDDFEIQPD